MFFYNGATLRHRKERLEEGGPMVHGARLPAGAERVYNPGLAAAWPGPVPSFLSCAMLRHREERVEEARRRQQVQPPSTAGRRVATAPGGGGSGAATPTGGSREWQASLREF